jgi:hypothetical protein
MAPSDGKGSAEIHGAELRTGLAIGHGGF